jgi:hypothetical protein
VAPIPDAGCRRCFPLAPTPPLRGGKALCVVDGGAPRCPMRSPFQASGPAEWLKCSEQETLQGGCKTREPRRRRLPLPSGGLLSALWDVLSLRPRPNALSDADAVLRGVTSRRSSASNPGRGQPSNPASRIGSRAQVSGASHVVSDPRRSWPHTDAARPCEARPRLAGASQPGKARSASASVAGYLNLGADGLLAGPRLRSQRGRLPTWQSTFQKPLEMPEPFPSTLAAEGWPISDAIQHVDQCNRHPYGWDRPAIVSDRWKGNIFRAD